MDHINKGDFTRAKDYHKQDNLLKYEFLSDVGNNFKKIVNIRGGQ